MLCRACVEDVERTRTLERRTAAWTDRTETEEKTGQGLLGQSNLTPIHSASGEPKAVSERPVRTPLEDV
jgi:hypothetical protein